MSMRAWLSTFAALLVLLPAQAAAPSFEIKLPARAADPALAGAMRDLAQRVLPVYEDADALRYLANLSALQLAAGSVDAAADTRRQLRERRAAAGEAAGGLATLFDVYAQARAAAAAGKAPLPAAFAQAYRERLAGLDDREAYALNAWLRTPPAHVEDALQRALDRARGRTGVDLGEALELVRAYLAVEARRSADARVESIAAEDGRRRYRSEENLRVRVRGPGGAALYLRVVRPAGATRRLPALLEIVDDRGAGEAEASAAHGYVGVTAWLRGQAPAGATGARVRPFEHDGEDARALIAWIARQPWSDGRVGMIGEGYGGFAAWAAARAAPPALQAIATVDPTAPGIDFPMRGQIFRNEAYRWAAGLGGASAVDDAARWQAFELGWFRSGRAYADFARGNPVFRRWLGHPSYDRYWRKFIPQGTQYAKLGIPVLTIAGYYSLRTDGALYYFTEHLRQRPEARHTLLLGPWDENALRPAPAPFLRGYALDAAARVDLRELRYQWLDSVFRKTAPPALLQDRVNYELMGADRWRHAATPEAAARARLRLYLQTDAAGAPRLSAHPPAQADAAIRQRVPLRARREAALPAPRGVLDDTAPSAPNALRFVSEPLPQPLELAGALRGHLDFRVNKMDLDLRLTLYEELPDGDWLQLCAPVEQRASYAADRTQRRLLRAGLRQQLELAGGGFCARALPAGSRIALLLDPGPHADRQINYGGGDDVSAESAADAGAPLKLEWYGGSYLELPLR